MAKKQQRKQTNVREATPLYQASALSAKHGLPLPWLTMHDTITNAINTRFIELAPDSAIPKTALVSPTQAQSATHPTAEQITKLNELLKEISGRLQFL